MILNKVALCFFAIILTMQAQAMSNSTESKSDVKAKLSSNQEVKTETPTVQYQFVKDGLDFKFRYFNETLKYSNATRGSNYNLKGDGGRELRLNWYLASGERWQPYITTGMRTIEYGLTPDDGTTHTSNHLWGMGVGMRYRSSRHFVFWLGLDMDQHHLIETQDSTAAFNKVLHRLTFTKITFLTDMLLWQKKKFMAKLLAGPFWSGHANAANLVAKWGYGAVADLTGTIWGSPTLGFSLGAQYRLHNVKVTNSYFEANTSRSSTGLFAQVLKTF